MASQERFGYEWGKYHEMDPNYEGQFARWVHPLVKEDFHKKRVLDAGCGMGRNSFWAVRWGAREVVGFDFDERSVAAAEKTLSGFGNARVEFRSIYEIEWENEFDIAFSIGVIHHLKNPQQAIENLARALKPRGVLLVWVYSKEGTEWFLWFLDPLRKNITSKLSVEGVHLLAYLFSVPLWFLVKIFRGPTAYLKQLAGFSFWHIHSIVFDQLIPEVANYWTKEEAKALLSEEDFQEVHVFRPPTNMGWTVIGIKK